MRSIIVIPTYNECDNIASLIEAVLNVEGAFNVLIVDDSSPDGTADIVQAHWGSDQRVHLLRRTGKRGLGLAYVEGFNYALSHGYEAVFSMDADFSHNPSNLPDLLYALESNEVAVGSRYCHGRVSVVNWPLSRLFLSVFAGKYVRVITGLKVSDPTSGFRGFRAEVLRAINLNTICSNGYSFQVETLFRAWKSGFNIAEIPIIFIERRDGKSKMSKSIIIEAIIMPWRMRFSRFRRINQQK